MARLFRREGERKSVWGRINDVLFTDVVVLARGGVDEGSLETLEQLLLEADFGVTAALRLVDRVEKEARSGRIRTQDEFLATLRAEIEAIVRQDADATALRFAPAGRPTVFLVVGVNGVGKTTTIGKLAYRLVREGRKVLLAAGDTFRAGAIDQLERWAERAGAEFVGARPGADPASVAFDAYDAAVKRGSDVVIIDTAGRLHTQSDLMQELQKVQRVLARKADGVPDETLLVLDATVGQNALRQARQFRDAVGLTGLVLAKLDGSAKGGIVVALREELGLPMKLVGLGEGIDDLEPFDAQDFLDQLLE
ncbi:MAG TPA: signal recognition particle-docking protein FtsY [Longimicrobiales bacterium]